MSEADTAVAVGGGRAGAAGALAFALCTGALQSGWPGCKAQSEPLVMYSVPRGRTTGVSVWAFSCEVGVSRY